ncbi:MAG: WG repeat-containing protein, partial [Burkholderiales bacterium]|nr:WG repeat-containing protein [Burkholderiales bacterium]
WPFSANGLAGAKENGRWGYINAQGEWVIPPKFKVAHAFTANGLAKVKEESEERGYENERYINAAGETIALAERICGFRVLKNSRNEIIWSIKSLAQMCEEHELSGCKK